MLGVMQVIGCLHAGKTTLSDLLLHELTAHHPGPVSVLALDASPDQRLTHRLRVNAPPLSLADVAERFLEKPETSNEAIDWMFHDLAQHVGEEIELVTVGHLPARLSPAVEKMMTYGFKRVVQAYDYVVMDGAHPFVSACLPEELVKTLVVISPQHWEHEYLKETPAGKTPAVIVNQCQEGIVSTRITGPLGAVLDDALEAGRIRLIGKLPIYPSQDVLEKELPPAFHNCLLRLDLPFFTSPSR